MNLKDQLQNLAQKFAVGGTTESGPGFGKKITKQYKDDTNREIVEFEDGTRMYTDSPEYRKLYSEGLLYGESPEKITYPQETGANSEMDRFKRIESENPYSDFVKPYFDGTSGVLARGFSQSEQNLANTPDDLKQKYDQDINKKWAQEIFKENPRNENEERGAYLNRVGSGLKPDILKNLYDYMPEREMETYWQLGEKGVAALTDLKGMPGLENFSNLEDYIQGSNHMSDYEKSKYFSNLKENPNSTRLGTAVGTLAPLGILAEIVVAGARDDYSVEDAGSGIQNNTSPWVKAAVDPLNLVGIGLGSKLGSASKFSKGLSALNKFSKESELSNTAKKLDLSHFANEDEFYRVIVGDNAYNDILESGLIRTKRPNDFQNATNGINLDRRGTTGYPSFSKGKVSTEYAQNNPEHYIISSKDPSLQPSTSGRHGKGSTMFPTDSNGKHLESLSADKTNIYKHVGDGNYEPVSNNFKSEINWGEWNAEIPNNTQLMREYDTIERTSKINGRWMKNADGSEFKGSPEQFIQQNLAQKFQAGGQVPTDWKAKYSTNPYFKDREDWGDKLQNKFPNAKNTVKESIYAASKRTGIDPGLLYTSAMEEGMKLALSGKDTGVRREGFVDYQKNNPKGAKEYPIDGGYYYGLNTFGDKYGKTIKQSNLPPGFKYTPYPQKGTDGSVAFNSAAFRTHEDAISAKAAQMKQVEEAMNYKLRDAKIDLSPEARKFFDMVGYNMGEEKTIEMIKSYQQKGYLKDDRFLDSKFQPASWKEPYTNVQRRYQNYRILNEQGYFKDYDTPNPKVAVTGSTKEPNSFQKGGQKPYSQKSYDVNDIRDFYGKMINSPEYIKRLYNNGYVDQTDKPIDFEGYREALNIAKERWRSVKNTSFLEKESNDGFSQQVKNLITGSKSYKHGSVYDSSNQKIAYIKSQADELKVHPRTIVSHEFGHAETDPGMSRYEGELIDSKLINKNATLHDKDAHEGKADINAVRYNLYKNGLFNPSTGQYKTKDGKFNPSLLESIKNDGVVKRMLENYGSKNMEYLINTIADNTSESTDLKYAQKGGMIRSELQKLSEKFSQRPSTT